MVKQTLDFIDTRIMSTISNLTINESKTYLYDFALLQSDGTYNIIFTGNVFIPVSSSTFTLDLSDLLRYNRWVAKSSDVTTERTTNIYKEKINLQGTCRWRILDSSGTYKSQYVTYANIYRQPRHAAGLEFTLMAPSHQTSKQICNLLQGANVSIVGDSNMQYVYGYTLLPHIPVFSNGKIDAPFVMQTYATSSSKTFLFRFLSDTTSTAINTTTSLDAGLATYYFCISRTLSGTQLNEDWTLKVQDPQRYTFVDLVHFDVVDKAKYYLMWQDRFGSFQCQPFCKTETYSEDFTTYEMLDYDNTRSILQVDNQPKFEINTGWISEDLYPFYESIFTSPFLVLFDTVNEVKHTCLITDKNYTEKTFKNQGRKLFNLKLSLELDKKQAITN